MAEPLVRPPVVTASISDSGVAVVKLNRFSVRNRDEVEQALQQVARCTRAGARFARQWRRRLQPVHLAGSSFPAGAARGADPAFAARQEQNARELRLTPATIHS